MPTADTPMTPPPPFPVRECLRFVAMAIVLMLCATGVTRIVVYELTTRGRPGYVQLTRHNRLRGIVDEAPGVMKSIEHRILAVGTSHVMLGFVPPAFDAAYKAATGRDVHSLNFAVNGLEGDFLRTYARWISSLARTYPADFAILEFSPPASTYQWAKLPGLAEYRDVGAALTEIPGALVSKLLDDPSRTVRLMDYRWAMGGATPKDVTAHLRQLLVWTPSFWHEKPKPGTEVTFARISLLPQTWDVASRGGRTDALDDPELIRNRALLQKPKVRTAMFDRTERMSKVSDLQIRPDAIDDVLTAARTLREHVPHLVIILTPVDMSVIKESPRGIASRHAAVERLAKESGACVLDMYDSPLFKTTDFDDADHLTRASAERFSAMVADKLAAWERAGFDCATLR